MQPKLSRLLNLSSVGDAKFFFRDAFPSILDRKFSSGYFNLDPNRVLDILLETFENRPQDDTLFVPLIRSYMSDRQVLCEVLGFKYRSTCEATPFSLQRVTALMLQHEVIELDDILPWLVPDDKIIITEHEQAMKGAKEYVRKMSVISTKDKEEAPEERESIQVSTKAILPTRLYIDNYYRTSTRVIRNLVYARRYWRWELGKLLKNCSIACPIIV